MVQLWRAFRDVIPLFSIVVLIGLISILVFLRLNRKRGVDLKRLVLNSLLAFTIIGVLFVTILPSSYGERVPRIINIVPFVDMYQILFHSVDIMVPIRNLGFNILLFVPFGFFMAMRKPLSNRRLGQITLIGAILSLGIEVVQYAIPMGRTADINDVILNTIGASLGCVIWIALQKVIPSLQSNDLTRRSHRL